MTAGSEASAAHRHSTMARSLRCQLCDATQFPMIQKMEKTGEILQVQHIDKVIGVLQTQLIDEAVEVPEMMQRHDPMIQEIEDAQKTCKKKAEAQLKKQRRHRQL